MENEVYGTVVPVESTETVSTSTDASDSSVGVTVESKAYRTYGVLDEKGNPTAQKKDAEGVIKPLSEPIISQQTADGKAWKKFEDDGNTKLTENIYKFYTVETIEGFTELITDPVQQIYYINRGLTAVQTAKANQIQKEFDETTKEFLHNDETIDMRDLLNEAPKRSKMTETQKIARDVSNLDPEEQKKLIANLLALLQAQGVSVA